MTVCLHFKRSEHDGSVTELLVPFAKRRVLRLLLAALPALFACLIALSEPAHADFRLCNNTGSRVGVAIGYKDAEGWTTEGWWNIAARSCDTLLRGALVARYYYIYAVDYDRGGEWSGHAFMCSREKEFTIRGTENCLARGYDRTGFFEVDTQNKSDWTLKLTDPAANAPNGTDANGTDSDGPPPEATTPDTGGNPNPDATAPANSGNITD